MWEQRWTWPGQPAWWDGAWRRGLEVLASQGRDAEERPDEYLVLLDRTDAGLKLRGGAEDDFDLKVLHDRSDGWELWEKVAFFAWNALEAVRLAALLRVPLPDTGGLGAPTTPGRAAELFLGAVGLAPSRVLVRKKRLQCRGADLLPSLPGIEFDPACLAELVTLEVARRAKPLRSLCIESMSPGAAVMDVPDSSEALRCGYPELLIRHLRGSL